MPLPSRLEALVRALALPDAEKERLLQLTPGSYTGSAAQLAARI